MSGATASARLFQTNDIAERYRLYAELAESGPVHRVILPHGRSAWLICRYAEARAALTDPRLVRAEPSLAAELDPDLHSAINNNLQNVDLPDHGRLRRLVGAALTRTCADDLESRIQQLTDELLDPLVQRAAGAGFDLIGDFARPLPIAVLCALLGVPESEQEQFRQWSWADRNAIEIGEHAYSRAAAAFVEHVRRLAASRRARPGDDLVTALLAARDGHDQLTEDELTSTIHVLLATGYETMTNLLGNGIHLLLSDRQQWRSLCGAPELVPGTVEELLRTSGPLQTTTPRVAVETFDFAGVTIEEGDTALVALLAANRDATAWPFPDSIDVDRSPNKHLAFGHGIHACVGAPLARVEARIALTSLLSRFPDLRLTTAPDGVTAEPGCSVNGLTALPVTTRPAPC